MVEPIEKVVRVSRQLMQELGREPTDEEVAERLRWSAARIKAVMEVALEAIYQPLKEQIEQVLGTLPEREQEVLRMRFGLDDGYSLTLAEVGLHFNVTRERIRQIEAKALRRLRHPKRAEQIKGAHVGGGRPALQGDQRAHPPDQGEGVPTAPPPNAERAAQELS